MHRIIDITPAITPDLAVFPGDTPPQRQVLLDLAKGDPVTLSTLHATCHLGAHADAPSHYGMNAPTIDERPLERYLGPCQVVRVNARPSQAITVADLDAEITQPRVLIRTGTFPDAHRWRDDFASLDPTLIDALASRGVRLIGVDTPSVDASSSKDLPSHARCLHHDIALLETLVLEDVPEGSYELIALPLPLVGFDASPVRAILRPLVAT